MNASSAMNSNIYSNRHDPFDKALSLHFLGLSPGEHCMRMRAIKIYNHVGRIAGVCEAKKYTCDIHIPPILQFSDAFAKST